MRLDTKEKRLTAGHKGVIYKASNAYRMGKTEKKRFYIDETGRLRHPRQCGHNITTAEAKEKGWRVEMRDSKNRFLWLLPDGKRHKKQLIQLSKYQLRPGEGEQ